MVIEKYKRHNWTMLQENFMTGDYKTLKEFAAVKGLNYKSSQFFVNTKGWLKIKEIMDMNPSLIDKYKLCFNRVLEDIPNHFFTSPDIWDNAAFTYINDTRNNHCTIKQIAEWYGLDYEEVKRRSRRENWKKYRLLEEKKGYGACEFINNHRD